MESTDLYRRDVIQKSAELIKVIKLKHSLKEREIAKGIGVRSVVMCHLKNSNYHHNISKISIQLLADFVNNKIYYDGDERVWKKRTIEGCIVNAHPKELPEDNNNIPSHASAEKKAMETVKKIEDIRKKKALVNMSLDNEIVDERLEKITDEVNLQDILKEEEKPKLGFWDLIDKAISVIPSNVSIQIRINDSK